MQAQKDRGYTPKYNVREYARQGIFVFRKKIAGRVHRVKDVRQSSPTQHPMYANSPAETSIETRVVVHIFKIAGATNIRSNCRLTIDLCGHSSADFESHRTSQRRSTSCWCWCWVIFQAPALPRVFGTNAEGTTIKIISPWAITSSRLPVARNPSGKLIPGRNHEFWCYSLMLLTTSDSSAHNRTLCPIRWQ